MKQETKDISKLLVNACDDLNRSCELLKKENRFDGSKEKFKPSTRSVKSKHK